MQEERDREMGRRKTIKSSAETDAYSRAHLVRSTDPGAQSSWIYGLASKELKAAPGVTECCDTDTVQLFFLF